MADPIKPPNQTQVLGSKDYGYGVSTQDTFTKPDYQTAQQPNQTQQPGQQVQAPPVMGQQAQAPQFRQGAAGSQSATSRLLNFARANQGAGVQKMQQGIQQGIGAQQNQYQNQIQNLGAQDATKGIGIAQSASNLGKTLNSSGGFKNLIQGALGTQSPGRAGIENFMLKSQPGAVSNIQNTSKQGFQNTLDKTNQYLGGFKTNVMQNGNTLQSLSGYGNLAADTFGNMQNRSEADIARDGQDEYEYVDEYEDVGEEGEDQTQQATGLTGALGMLGKTGQKLSPYADAAAAGLAKMGGPDINALTNINNPAAMLKAASGASQAQAAAAKAAEVGKQAAATAQATASKVANQAKAAVSNAASSVGGAVRSIFCHAAGTLIMMGNGSVKPIEEIQNGDILLFGGEVFAIASMLQSDTYKYKETIVTGSHAVYEDNRWIRVEDSEIAEYLGEAHEVYPVITENHIIITSDGTVWKDYEEVDDSEDLSDEEILNIMNNR